MAAVPRVQRQPGAGPVRSGQLRLAHHLPPGHHQDLHLRPRHHRTRLAQHLHRWLPRRHHQGPPQPRTPRRRPQRIHRRLERLARSRPGLRLHQRRHQLNPLYRLCRPHHRPRQVPARAARRPLVRSIQHRQDRCSRQLRRASRPAGHAGLPPRPVRPVQHHLCHLRHCRQPHLRRVVRLTLHRPAGHRHPLRPQLDPSRGAAGRAQHLTHRRLRRLPRLPPDPLRGPERARFSAMPQPRLHALERYYPSGRHTLLPHHGQGEHRAREYHLVGVAGIELLQRA